MPISLQSLKDETSKKDHRRSLLKRVLVITSLVVTNVASYVVGSDGVSLGEIAKVIVRSIAQGAL